MDSAFVLHIAAPEIGVPDLPNAFLVEPELGDRRGIADVDADIDDEPGNDSTAEQLDRIEGLAFAFPLAPNRGDDARASRSEPSVSVANQRVSEYASWGASRAASLMLGICLFLRRSRVQMAHAASSRPSRAQRDAAISAARIAIVEAPC